MIRKVLRGRGVHVDPRTIEEPVIADQKDVDRGAGHFRAMNIIWNVFEAERNPAVAGWRMRFKAELAEIDGAMPRNNDRHGNA